MSEVKHIPIKRLFDLLFSTAVLTVGAPLFAVIALLIKLSSRGRAVYSHERIGRGGKPFPCYKFRTMYPDADDRLDKLLLSSKKRREEWEKSHKLKNDPRVTPIGAFLRKTSLDELPQFWNVLKGDLSVVGPRPVVQDEIAKHFGSKAKKIFSIRPGITGLWQISGRSDTSYVKRVALDERYVEHRSLWLDLKIVFKTIPAMFFPKGAY